MQRSRSVNHRSLSARLACQASRGVAARRGSAGRRRSSQFVGDGAAPAGARGAEASPQERGSAAGQSSPAQGARRAVCGCGAPLAAWAAHAAARGGLVRRHARSALAVAARQCRGRWPQYHAVRGGASTEALRTSPSASAVFGALGDDIAGGLRADRDDRCRLSVHLVSVGARATVVFYRPRARARQGMRLGGRAMDPCQSALCARRKPGARSGRHALRAQPSDAGAPGACTPSQARSPPAHACAGASVEANPAPSARVASASLGCWPSAPICIISRRRRSSTCTRNACALSRRFATPRICASVWDLRLRARESASVWRCCCSLATSPRSCSA